MKGKQVSIIISRSGYRGPENNQTTGILDPLFGFLGELGCSPQYHPSEGNYNSGEIVDFRNGEKLATLYRWPKLQKTEDIPSDARQITLMLGPGVKDPAKAAEEYRTRVEGKGFKVHRMEVSEGP